MSGLVGGAHVLPGNPAVPARSGGSDRDGGRGEGEDFASTVDKLAAGDKRGNQSGRGDAADRAKAGGEQGQPPRGALTSIQVQNGEVTAPASDAGDETKRSEAPDDEDMDAKKQEGGMIDRGDALRLLLTAHKGQSGQNGKNEEPGLRDRDILAALIARDPSQQTADTAAVSGDPVAQQPQVGVAADGAADTSSTMRSSVQALVSGVAFNGLRSALRGETGDRKATPGTAGGSAVPSDAADDMFRFARGDRTPDEVRLPAAATDKTPAVSARQSIGEAETKGETVQRGMAEISILDSRKFLGVDAGQTATAAVIATVTENAEWNAMLRETSATSASILNGAKNASNTLKIQLSPVELGMVTATFRLADGQLSIELKVETIEAYRQLSDDNNSIIRALKGHGYDVESITVQHVGKGETGGSATNGGGQQQGQGAGDGRFGETGQGQGERRQPAGSAQAAHPGEPDGGAAAGRVSGDVYL